MKTGACCGFERVSIVIHQVHYRNAMLSARLNLAMNGRNQHRLKAPRYPHSLRHMPTIMQSCSAKRHTYKGCNSMSACINTQHGLRNKKKIREAKWKRCQ